MRFFKNAVATVASAALMCAALVSQPALALADGGAGGGGSGGTGPGGVITARLYGHWWHDSGSFSPTGEFVPDQGWDEASIVAARARTEAQTGMPISNTGVESVTGVKHIDRFYQACRDALQNARARAGQPNARVIGAGYAYMPLINGGGSMGFWQTGGHTFRKLLPSVGNADELPASIGWDGIKAGTGKSWRQYAYDQAAADLLGDQYRLVVVAVAKNEPQGFGQVLLRKRPTDANVVEANGSYSLQGARYGVYSTSDCAPGSLVTEMVTGADGTAEVKVPSGRTYWVKEIAPSKGYKLSSEVKSVMVTTGVVSTVDMAEEPKDTSIDIAKVIKDEDRGTELGDIKLSGAIIEVKFFRDGNANGAPTYTWRFMSNDAGVFPVTDEAYLGEGSDPLLRNRGGRVVFPLGTYTVQELKAPAGLLLEGQTNPNDTAYRAPVHTFDTSANASIVLDIDDPLKLVEVDIHKQDSDNGDTPQGDASLEGVRFEMYNKSLKAVKWRGQTYAPDVLMTDQLTVRWDAQAKRYVAEPDDLPYGTYLIREVVPGVGYELNPMEYILEVR